MNKNIEFLIIPDPQRLEESLALAGEYGLGFEFDDFFHPDILDDVQRTDSLISLYKSVKLPDTLTMHGDFYDVLVFSEDTKIREISEMRVRQSMDIAVRLGVSGIVFHTNHVPNFRLPSYIKRWTEMNCLFWKKMLNEYPNIDIYIENMFDSSPDMLAGLGAAMSGEERFGICFDYAHACAFGDENDTAAWCSSLAPYVRHMHINDNDLKDDLHLAVGDGRIDWALFSEQLGTVLSPRTILIETASIDRQRRSVEFLIRNGMMTL